MTITVVMERLTHIIRRGGITMSWKLFSFGGLLLLAGALALVTPDSAQAQHRGGGHGGGFHAGGFNGHAVHGGGFNGGYRYQYPHTGSWGHQHYYPHHGYYPYVRWYGSYPYYYPSYGWYGSYPYYYDSGYYNFSGNLPSYSDGGSISPDATYQADTSAHIMVRLPANARLWGSATP
jgi:hypothetical protein